MVSTKVHNELSLTTDEALADIRDSPAVDNILQGNIDSEGHSILLQYIHRLNTNTRNVKKNVIDLVSEVKLTEIHTHKPRTHTM